MKTHFDPYRNDEFYDGPSPCGTIVGENYSSSANWNYVTCKRCLKKRKIMQISFDSTEKEIIRQMGDMAEFFEKCEKCNLSNCDNCLQTTK